MFLHLAEWGDLNWSLAREITPRQTALIRLFCPTSPCFANRGQASSRLGGATILGEKKGEGHTKYNIIYADPPWDFGNRMYSSNKNDHHREITRAYQTMKTKDICALPVKELAAEDCALFIWTTDAHLPDCLEVIQSWGFTYKTVAFIWRKMEKSGIPTCYMGQWTMKNCEIVLLATRGKMTQHLKSRRVRQYVEATRERTIHSRKPQVIRDKIVEMFGDLPRVELFARTKAKGWDAWGNEVDSDIAIDGREEV